MSDDDDDDDIFLSSQTPVRIRRNMSSLASNYSSSEDITNTNNDPNTNTNTTPTTPLRSNATLSFKQKSKVLLDSTNASYHNQVSSSVSDLQKSNSEDAHANINADADEFDSMDVVGLSSPPLLSHSRSRSRPRSFKLKSFSSSQVDSPISEAEKSSSSRFKNSLSSNTPTKTWKAVKKMVFRRKSEVTLTPNNYSHNHTIMNTTINDTTQTQNKSANNENKAHIDNENYQGPTPFHTSCYLASSLEEMEDCYEQSRINEKHQHSHHLEPDGEGRFPLDLLFLNSALAESLQVEDSSSSTSTSSQMMNMNMNMNMSFDKKRLRKVAEFALDIIAHQSAWENENNNKSVSTRNNIVNKWGIQIKWHVFDYWIQQVEGRNDECTGRVPNNNSHYSQWSFIKMFGNPSSRLGVTKLQHDDNDDDDDDDDDVFPRDCTDSLSSSSTSKFIPPGGALDFDLEYSSCFTRCC